MITQAHKVLQEHRQYAHGAVKHIAPAHIAILKEIVIACAGSANQMAHGIVIIHAAVIVFPDVGDNTIWKHIKK